MICSAVRGGVSRGYQLAGFHVTGVDIKPQPNYIGDEFRPADAMDFPLEGFDVIHASPPCQRYMRGGLVERHRHPDLLGPIRERLVTAGLPYVLENVPGAPMRRDVVLCGSMFGLEVRRHRWFEIEPTPLILTPSCDHSYPIAGVYGNAHGAAGAWPGMLPSDLATWSGAMDIDWMSTAELADAVPPAYTEFIGRHLMAALKVAV